MAKFGARYNCGVLKKSQTEDTARNDDDIALFIAIPAVLEEEGIVTTKVSSSVRTTIRVFSITEEKTEQRNAKHKTTKEDTRFTSHHIGAPTGTQW
eukprot:CAMPEP_0195524488 /NCGR_PEP_ID=MMETSP0794_2-20130614/24358_1 /TAXON_ID=515487 /ORGANISM="Stephanopyxis turris, Strain CCMP 815" /LENGTH=95 /DNA_ID=CAMNT_0040654723 /DNA_START=194 /DNA_END=478 /DNA_ORIENTATION=+